MKKRILSMLVTAAMVFSAAAVMPVTAGADLSGALHDFSGTCGFCDGTLVRRDLGKFTSVRLRSGGAGSGAGGGNPFDGWAFDTPNMSRAGWETYNDTWEHAITPVTSAELQSAEYLVLEVDRPMKSSIHFASNILDPHTRFTPEQVFDGQNTIMIPMSMIGGRAQFLNRDISSFDGFLRIEFAYANAPETNSNSLDRLGDVSALGVTAAYILLRDDCEGDKVSTPLISAQDREWTRTFYLASETRGASIYYTLDGSTPSSLSTPYKGNLINLPQGKTTTIKAIAIKDAMEDSEILTATFAIPSANATTAGGPGVLPSVGGWRVFSISFNLNGGTSSAINNRTTDANGRITLPAAPTRAGYTFAGWFTAAAGGTRTEADRVYTADTALFAQWTANQVQSQPVIAHKFTTADALNILRYVAGIVTLTDEQRERYGINGGGNITTANALRILQIVAGLEELPEPESETTPAPMGRVSGAAGDSGRAPQGSGSGGGGSAGAGGGGNEGFDRENRDPWAEYLNIRSHTRWPNATLWANLDGTFPVREYPKPYTPPSILPSNPDNENSSGDSDRGSGGSGGGGGGGPPPPVLPQFRNLGELFTRFLSAEHRITDTGAGFTFSKPERDRFDYIVPVNVEFMNIEFINDNAEKALPIFSLLSSWRNVTYYNRDDDSEIDEMYFWTNLYVYGQINITITTNNLTSVDIVLWPWDEIFVYVSGYDGAFMAKVESGTFEKLLSYLILLSI
ncbi:MAG: InlB B-repeat-containing protein [Oscillospiraceae bacterium]|jgi:uncharacterized repeat protein (TIGR02543 family)|nr:InlB B-repeat-containing protein [Oscillospiraceae bacterium]